jgi:hypothetical protein
MTNTRMLSYIEQTHEINKTCALFNELFSYNISVSVASVAFTSEIRMTAV